MAKENKTEKEKLFVVGWTDYDSEYFPACTLTDEVYQAVADEVRDKNYLFGGNSHQDYSGCCPVLNNGCKAAFSCRGWGLVIAMAYNQRGRDGRYDIMCGYMDSMIKPSAVRYPEEGVKFALIDDKGKTYKLVAPTSQYGNDWIKKFEARVDSDELKQLQAGDYLDMTVCDEDGLPFAMDTYKITDIFRGATFEDVIRQADEIYYTDAEYFGYPGDWTKEQLIEQLYKDYPREQVEKNGAVLFRAVAYVK